MHIDIASRRRCIDSAQRSFIAAVKSSTAYVTWADAIEDPFRVPDASCFARELLDAITVLGLSVYVPHSILEANLNMRNVESCQSSRSGAVIIFSQLFVQTPLGSLHYSCQS